MADVRRAVSKLNEERQKVEAMIAKIEGMLERIKRGDLSSTQPWVSPKTGPIENLEMLRSPHKSLREALEADLLVLKQQVREIARQPRVIPPVDPRNPSAGPIPVPAPVARPATAASLNQEVKSGLAELTKLMNSGDEEAAAALVKDLQGIAGQALSLSIGALRLDPSNANLTMTVQSIAMLSALGGDEIAIGDAWIAVGGAAQKRMHVAEERFRTEATTEGMAKMLGEWVLGQSIGVELEYKREGWVPAGRIEHVTAMTGKADTLSGLSQKYYGSFGFWDVIFLENHGVIGSDPNKLLRGIVLIIP